MTLDRFAERMERGFQQLRQEMTDGFNVVTKRLDAHAGMISAVAKDVTEIRQDVGDIRSQLNRMEPKLDDTIGRTDDHGARLKRLEEHRPG